MRNHDLKWEKLCRVTLGTYLLIHFAMLVRWGPELFSSAGTIPNAASSPFARLFPNILSVFDSPSFVKAILVTAALLAFFLTVGVAERFCAFLLWYVGACLFGRNPLIANPAMPYVGWILLAYSLVPKSGDSEAPIHSGRDHNVGRQLLIATWILMATGYTYSGVMKLSSPSWLDGSAIQRILMGPLARPNALRGFVLQLPPVVLRAFTWSALLLELFFGPVCIFRKLRPYAWTAMVALHCTLLALIAFGDLTVGMLILHLFTFDPRWLRRAIPGFELSRTMRAHMPSVGAS